MPSCQVRAIDSLWGRKSVIAQRVFLPDPACAPNSIEGWISKPACVSSRVCMRYVVRLATSKFMPEGTAHGRVPFLVGTLRVYWNTSQRILRTRCTAVTKVVMPIPTAKPPPPTRARTATTTTVAPQTSAARTTAVDSRPAPISLTRSSLTSNPKAGTFWNLR